MNTEINFYADPDSGVWYYTTITEEEGDTK